MALERGEIALGQVEDAARRQDRLGDEGGERAGRLAVDEVEAVVELRLPVVVRRVAEARPIAVGSRNGEAAGLGRPVTFSAMGIGGGGGRAGHAVPRLGEGHNLVAAGHQLGQPDGGLVRFRAGAEEDRARQRLGQDLRHGLGKPHDGPRQHTGEQMRQVAGRVRDRLDDLGVAVAENGAHLARGEIEDGAAFGIVDIAAPGVLDDDGRELAAVAHQVGLRRAPERRVLVGVHGGLLHLSLPASGRRHYHRRAVCETAASVRSRWKT
jgi:hypothetical protein